MGKDIDEIWLADFPSDKLELCLPLLVGQSNNKGILIHEQLLPQLDYNYSAIPKLKIPFVSLSTSPLSWWQKHLKRIIDLVVSVIALGILSPVIIILALRVKTTSSGGIFYRQERIGRWGIPFQIIKFRTMIQSAETSGPQLATKNDPRYTKIGGWMRKWRLDEIPQFLNVIKGDMSLVGPRPERAYFTNQLIEANHLYPYLWQVRPGITSWGQIKFGYASDINQMLQRFRFDLLYIENMGLLLDLRILYYTVIVLFQGKGR
ncbi:UNVERIFIED_CONTAM: hypothetical protein GTU68_015293 [Idotea baltica]|nr:hypothetical protein [Idotea baltica]